MKNFILFFVFIFITQNVFANENNFEIVLEPIEFKIFGRVFTDKISVDNFLNNEDIFMTPNTLSNLVLIKIENSYKVIKGGKYYNTFLLESENNKQPNNTLMILFLLIMICILVLSSLYLMFRFKWKKLDETKLVTFPEEAVQTINAMKNAHQVFIREIQEFLKDSQTQQNEKINNINDQLDSFRTLAEERGAELKRFKDGYDFSNLKSLILSIVDNIQNINKYLLNPELKNSPTSRYLEATKDKLEITLQMKGVEEYIPEKGKLIVDVIGCRAVATEITKNDEQINIIYKINKPGYKIATDDGNIKIIKEAEVTVYAKGEINE